jgi:hypothetical protein
MGAARARGAEREHAIREQLAPLEPGERPLSLRVAVVVAALLALAVVVGAASSHHLRERGGSWYGAAFIAIALVAAAVGMWRQRYWAVLAFEALLAFQIIVTALALTVAATWWAALGCVASISLAGVLFWKLIRVMARLQTPGGSDPEASR